jgi:dienelactone hydrolase
VQRVVGMRNSTCFVAALLLAAGCTKAGGGGDALGSGGSPAPVLLVGSGGSAPQKPVGGAAGIGVPNGVTNVAGQTGAGGQVGSGGAPAGTGGAPGTGGGPDVADSDASVAQPGPGGLPRADEMNVEQMGPYKFMSYTEGLDDPAYGSAIMYYPEDATPPFASAVFSPGFTATKEQYMNFLGELLASHGIAMLLTTPTTTGDLPTQRAEDLEAAVAVIAKENTRQGGPLEGKLAPDRVCVTGHSMGGGGTLWAATDLGNKIRCAVPLQPWQPGQSFDAIVAPTMFIAAQSDSVAGVAQNAALFYASIPETVPKYYVEFAGASHFLTTNDLGTAYDGQSKYMIAFYKVYLEDDMRYLDVLNAPADMELSAYEKSK